MVMIHCELPYVSRVGLYLPNFSHKNQYLWNSSCPVCGDMSKGKQKKRFYIYRPGNANHLNCKCHHCGYSTSFGSFLKLKFPEFYKEFVFEQYQQTSKSHVPHANAAEMFPVLKKNHNELVDVNMTSLKSCESLKDEHPVAKFLKRRMIPRDKWNLLFYTVKFKKYTNSIIPNKFKDIEEDHPRLVIPYTNEHGKMFAFVARAFGKEEPRYYTMKIDDSERIFGLDRLDYSKRIYAVEGPIDSLFIDNTIAVSGSNFDCETTRALKSSLVLVPDNEPRSKEICKLILKHINLGYKVCLLPHSIKTKDINDHILSGLTAEQVKHIIDENTFQGAEALLKFTQWKMVE